MLGPDDQVVVVDNGSTDATAGELAALARVTVVTNPANRGLAAACNQGARRSPGARSSSSSTTTRCCPGAGWTACWRRSPTPRWWPPAR
ncbi:MAG: glycosyltransferase [Candidatus Binatia bacterium]